MANACPGTDVLVASGGASGDTATALCTQDYTGVLCTQCSQHAYQLQGHCYSCGDDIDQTRTITLTVLAMSIAMLLLAVAVACLSAPRLALTVQVFQLLQGAATVGVQGAKYSPVATQQLLQVFTGHTHTLQQEHEPVHAQEMRTCSYQHTCVCVCVCVVCSTELLELRH